MGKLFGRWHMADKQPLVAFGQKFNRLTVVGEIDRSNPSAPRVVVQCDCGTKKSVIINALKTGRTKSCGCLQKERAKNWNSCMFRRKS